MNKTLSSAAMFAGQLFVLGTVTATAENEPVSAASKETATQTGSMVEARANAKTHSESAPRKLIFSPRIEGDDTDGLGEFVRVALETELSASPGIQLLDRRRLEDSLGETARGEIGDSALESQLGLTGADFAVYPKINRHGKNVLLSYRVVDIKSTAYRSVLFQGETDSDPMEIVTSSAEQIRGALDELGVPVGDGKSSYTVKFNVPKDLPRFTVALRIPESSTRNQNPDPAADKTLSNLLKDQGYELVQLSRPSQSVAAGVGDQLEGEQHKNFVEEAKQVGVEVLILGSAVSDPATRLGSYHVAKARVELSAIATDDSAVLASTSGYGVATDLSRFNAEKQAIEDAVSRCGTDFLTSVSQAVGDKEE